MRRDQRLRLRSKQPPINESVSGITVAESGQPYSVYDFSGAAGGIFFSANDFITNPIIPAIGNAPLIGLFAVSLAFSQDHSVSTERI